MIERIAALVLATVAVLGALLWAAAYPPGAPAPASWACSSAIRTCPTTSPPTTAAQHRG